MSSTAPLHPQCALDTLERMQYDNTELAAAIFRATMRFMRASGFPTSEDLWDETAETIVRQAHSDRSREIGRKLWDAVQGIHNKGGVIGLFRKFKSAMANRRELDDEFDSCMERLPELSPAQKQLFLETFPKLHASITPANQARTAVTEFLRMKHHHIRFLEYMRGCFYEVTAPMRSVRRDRLVGQAENALKILRPLQYKPFALVYETLEEVRFVASELRSLDGHPIRNDVFVKKLSGITAIRAKLVKLLECSAGLFQEFEATLHAPVALPTTLHGDGNDTFNIEELLDAARFYLQADGLLARTHQFDETRALMDMLRREASWTA
ncbi:hypothetical protein FKP32DRAFT_1682254 [Trametes sanguinea]|nr:hypothetical protein FKP32DRAFT_1682254 [Trametes sanguinea]